ncbi:MAG: hypothetical protein ACXVEE_11430 [Polyangiales bacterium]
MNLRGALVVSFALLSACSSSDFAVAGEGAPDSQSSDGESTDTGTVVTDSESSDTGTVTSDAPSEAAVCAPLDMAATTIYVDQRTTRTSIGTADCPTKTIKEALAIVGTLPSGKHTIKVAGGAVGSPITYAESSVLILKANTTLSGDGPARVVITGGGMCSGTPCIVAMEGNSTLDGVKIDANGSKSVPLVMTPGAFTNCVVSHTVITGVKGTTMNPGVFISGNGTVDLGPELVVQKNDSIGVYADSIFSIHVIAAGNKFNENLAGLVMKVGGLNFDGGEVGNNASVGLSLGAANGTINITGLDAHDNGQHGLVVDKGASLKMRSSSLNKNGRFGLVFNFTTGLGANDLDLGKALDLGKNLFGASTGSNKFGGICLPISRAAKGDAQGDKWSTCDPIQSAFPDSTGNCDATPAAYADIWYAPNATATTPLTVAGCTVGM